ncbi:MAG: hypothetical protein ACI93R_002757 [Flavobacteriales bacterium]|jgi:hypothetical protein
MNYIQLNQSDAFDIAISSRDKYPKVVVCGSSEGQPYIDDAYEACSLPTKSIIEQSLQIDTQEWFKQRKLTLEQERNASFADIEGQWPGEDINKPGFTLALDILTGAPIVELIGANVDTEKCWQIPAYFKFGGWNTCPSPAEHCAIWRYWEERYGAQIVGISNDVIEAHVSNPPNSQEEALRLAWEQTLYCSDIVEQGVETVAGLASSIISHKNWFFWWE